MEAELIRTQGELERSQDSLDSVLQERDQWKSKFLATQQDLFHVSGECARQICRLFRATEQNQILTQDLSIQKTVAANLTAENARLKEQVVAGKAELEEMVATFQRTLADTTSSLVPVTHAQWDELHAQIDNLQHKNKFLRAISHEGENCEQHSIRVWEQLQNANQMQSVAEAEADGLRHLAVQNDLLQEAHIADAKRIADLIMANTKLEGEVSRKPLTSTSSSQNIHEPASGFQAENGTPDMEFSVAGLLSSQLTPPACYGQTSPTASPANSICNSPCLPPQKTGPVSSSNTLSLSTVQTITVSPEPHYARARLTLAPQLSRGEIQAVSTAPISLHYLPQHPTVNQDLPSTRTRPSQTSQKRLQCVKNSKGNAALTIYINAGTRKGSTLLSRLQSVLSKTSPLDIHGPRELVQEFIQDMDRFEAIHQQILATAAHWETTATKALHELAALQTQPPNQPRCTDPVHKNLEDELEASEARNLMQLQLLADWRDPGRE